MTAAKIVLPALCMPLLPALVGNRAPLGPKFGEETFLLKALW